MEAMAIEIEDQHHYLSKMVIFHSKALPSGKLT
jgi:hypothetical protein